MKAPEAMVPSPKPRRIDLYPDDVIAGNSELDLEERGFYETAKLLIYSKGGPITDDHLRKGCPSHGRTFNRLLGRMLALGKLYRTDDGKLSQKRCETELKNARNRIETSQKNGQKGGRLSSKNNDITKPAGSSRAREGVTSTITTTNLKEANEGDGPGRSAPSVEDVAAVDRTVERVVVALKGRGRPIRDPAAYDAAVDSTVWDAWLNNIGRCVMRALKGQAMLDALEAVEEARSAGSREATPPHVRKVLNDLDKLDRAERLKNRHG